ncbi:hypothetical protein PTKIN_Ptkin14bG0041500 [Pterospermum kingtungense]
MTAEEVTVVHAAEEEVVAVVEESSSSKVEVVVEKEEKELEDLSNGVNGRIVKEETDGDGDGDGDGYVFVNGKDVMNGDPVELDLEKKGNGIGGEDRGVENLESKGEVKSESDLVKNLEGESDQDKELCHVEAPPVDEQKTESDPVVGSEHTVSEASGDSCATLEVISDSNGGCSKVNENSEMVVVDDLGCNGNGLANDSIEDIVVESRSKENEDSVVADDVGCSGIGLATDRIEDIVVESKSKENEDSELAAADDVGCNGNGVLDSRSKENEESEMAVADDVGCNGNGLANDSIEDSVLDSRSKKNGDSEVAVADDVGCNGSGLTNDIIEDILGDSNSKENGDSEIAVADDVVVDSRSIGDEDSGIEIVADEGDCKGDVKETVSEGAFDTINEDARGKPDVGEEVTVPEAVLVDRHNDGVPVSVSDDSNGDSLPVNAENTEQNGLSVKADNVPDVPNDLDDTNRDSLPVDADNTEQNGFSAKPDNVADVSKSLDDVGVENTEQNAFSAKPDNVSDATSSNDTVLTDVASGNETVLVHQDAASVNETVNEAPVEDVASVNKTVNEAPVEDVASVNETLNEAPVEGVDSHLEKEVGSISDSKLESEVIKSDENNRRLDSCHVENSWADVVESGSVDDDSNSSCLADGLKSITETPDDTVSDSLEPVAAGDTHKKVSVAVVQDNSSLAAPLSNDEKAPDAVENLPNSDTNDNEDACPVIKEGIQFGSVFACEEPEVVDEVRRSPFYYLIKVPRYDDENLKEKTRLAQIRVDEKTQSRDAIRVEWQSKRATSKEYNIEFEAAIAQERAARELHKSKREEIEHIQSAMNIEDIDAKIRNMEHMIQHETLPLKDEKQFIREINQLKLTRHRLSSNMGRQDEVQEGTDQKVQIEERLKSLRKEADQLRVNLLKAEAVTKAAKKKLHDENDKANKLQAQFRAADAIRQEAYAQLQSLKKESYEKNKYFWQYRDDAKKAYELASKGDKEALQNLCLSQDKKIRDLWSNNDGFRKDYVRCNLRSTLRRLRTLDGRGLGPDEEPPVMPPVVNDRVAKDHTVSSSTLEEQTQEKVAPAKAEKAIDKPVAKAVEQKKHASTLDKSSKSVPQATVPTTASIEDKIEEAVEEKPKRTKEEEEAARKAEELRKEEEAAKLREQRRLEEIAKAKEALERKKRIAEKAQARAALRAQKEAEEKEKEREKRAKKKERRKVAATAVVDASVTDETGAVPTSETPAETPKEPENKEKTATVAKRTQKPSQFTKQSKAKSIPPPLRNRGKKRMQTWMWVLLTALVIFALFLIGNYNFSFNFGLQSFNFKITHIIKK